MADDSVAQRLVRGLLEGGSVPAKTLVVVVAMGTDGNVTVASVSPIPTNTELLQGLLVEAFEVLGHPKATRSSEKIDMGKA